MYKIWTYITQPVGNNEFHYDERIALWSKGKIFVPSVIQSTVADLKEWSEIVFEEENEWKLVSCTGLKHFIQTTYKWIPTYIFDNHNHALFFRYHYRLNVSTFERLVVLHIDQHADTKENKNTCPPLVKEGVPFRVEDFETFVNEKTNVGNFISTALHNRIIDEVIQIRSEHTLQQLWTFSFQLSTNYILDIDVDFWEDKSEKEIESDFEIIRKIINNVCLITIATSPYFMNQKKAIELVKKLFENDK